MSKNAKTRIVKLPKSSDVHQQDPDWDCPLKFGFFVGQELETNFYAIVKVENLFESVDEIFKAFDEMAPVSFKNHEGRISHCTLIFYGSEAKCLRFLDHLLGERKTVFLEKNSAEDHSGTSSDNADIVDLTSSPEKKKPKQIHGEKPGSSNEDLNLKTRQGKSNSEKALQEHGDQSKNDKETESSRRESSALTDELTLELMIQSITELEQKLNKLSEKVDESREELSAKLQDLVDIMSVKTQNRQAEIMPEKLVEAELACQFMKILVTQRASQEWREKIKKQKIAGVTSEQERNIKKLFLFGTITVGSFMRGLAREIFGEERLRKTLLGDSGEFLKGIKQQTDRSEIFSTDEELLLTNILKLIDPVFFSSRETYKLLVREKINSYGRDLKKIPFEKGPNVQQKDITRYFNKISRPNQETTQMAQEKEKDLRQEDNQASSSKSGQDLDPSQENANKSIPKCSWWTKSSK